MGIDRRSDRREASSNRRAKSPEVEGLEGRLLLATANGGRWAFDGRITYSLVPDGTSVGGTPSALYSTLNAKFATATWQAQIQKAAAIWAAVADINLVQVPDSGAALGTSGYQQGDSRFGDIRIGAIPQSGSQLGFAYSPPPINGGTVAGDILFNSNQNWQINNDYDLLTVAIHEFGHALGMGHSAITTADMYAAYNGMKQTLSADDTAGIRSIYGARTPDAFDAAAPNNTQTTPTTLTPYLDASAKASFSGLDITTATDVDWFKVTVPASNSGKLVVTMQSKDLSSLSPRIQVYNTALASLALDSEANTFGETASVTITGVSAGQTYLIRASAASTGATGVGGYGLTVNMGSTLSAALSPPITLKASQADAGGGTSAETVETKQRGPSALVRAMLEELVPDAPGLIRIGSLFGWGEYDTAEGGSPGRGPAAEHPASAGFGGSAGAQGPMLYALPVDQVLSNPSGEILGPWGRARKRG